MGTAPSTFESVDKWFWDVISGDPTTHWIGEEHPSFVFPLATPPYYRDLLEDNGIDITQPFYLTPEGISREAQHKFINVRALNRLLSIDVKSFQFVAVNERQWKLLFSYVPPVLPCEVIISFYVKMSPYSTRIQVDSAVFTSDPIFIAPRDSKSSPSSKQENNDNSSNGKHFCVRFDSIDYNIMASATSLPSLKHCTKYPADHVFDVTVIVRPAATKTPSPTHAQLHPNKVVTHTTETPHEPKIGFGHNQVSPAPAETGLRQAESTTASGIHTQSSPSQLKKGMIMPLEMLNIPSLFVPANVTSEWSPERYVWQEIYTFRVDPTFLRPFATKFVEEEKTRAKLSSMLKKETKRMQKAKAAGTPYTPPPGLMITPNGLMPIPLRAATIPNHPNSANNNSNTNSNDNGNNSSLGGAHAPHIQMVMVQPTTTAAGEPSSNAVVPSGGTGSPSTETHKRRGSHKDRKRGDRPNEDSPKTSSRKQHHHHHHHSESHSNRSNLPVNVQVHLPQQQQQQMSPAQQAMIRASMMKHVTPTIFTHPAQMFPIVPLLLQFQKVELSESLYTVMEVYGQKRRMAALPLVKEMTVNEDNHWTSATDTAATKPTGGTEKTQDRTAENDDSVQKIDGKEEKEKKKKSRKHANKKSDKHKQQKVTKESDSDDDGIDVFEEVAATELDDVGRKKLPRSHKERASKKSDKKSPSSLKNGYFSSSSSSSASDGGDDSDDSSSDNDKDNDKDTSKHPDTKATTNNDTDNPNANGATATNKDDEDQNCIVCLSEPREVVLFPCRHLNTCLPCAKLLIASRNQCPMCRSTAEAIIHIPAFKMEAEQREKEKL